MQWLLPALLVVVGQAYAQDNARRWLDEMSSAMQSLDYDGTFVYLHDGKLEAMRIVHQAGEYGEMERLVSLTGSPREVLRDDRVVTCIIADSKSVMVGQSRPRQPFPVVPGDLDRLSRNYRLQELGEDRMAGYLSRVISITPKDRFRYGYRFWIDASNYMLLKSDLTDVDGEAIEQVMFTRLNVGGSIPVAALQPSLTGDGYSWTRQGTDSHSPAARPGKPGWAVKRLPVGFELTDFQHKRMRKEGASVEHMVFSDGLATMSVYVEKLKSDADAFQGLSSMGAMHAFGAVVDGYQVTVVGEVPPATVQMVANSVGPSGPDHD
ncbi:MAG: MucB/RseB C-terminal domain-containing protein [Gammaproteobacteria bacterium]|nr:MucB/RseB C-terminal domain-containing protein [Gammaproteobacteria bacterium]